MTLAQVFVLLPILIIGCFIIIIMLSIAYRRRQFMHAILTIISLGLSVLSVGIIKDQLVQFSYIKFPFQLIYIDNFSILSMILVLVASIASSILSYNWLLHYPGNRDEFYLLLLISSIGGVSLVIANHLAVLFIGMELMSLPLFGLISYSFFQKFSLEAGIKYIILSGISSSFLLFGMALIYADTGHLSFDYIKQVLYNHYSEISYYPVYPILIIIGFGMMMIGFGFKLSFFPFHLWTPDVYHGSPYPISMYLITGKIAIVSIFIRFFLMFPDEYSKKFCIFLSGISCCSILFGNIMAIRQKDIKRILAYTSISNIGYLLIAIISLRIDCMSLETIGIYLINYLIAYVGIFSIISIVSILEDTNRISSKDVSLLTFYRGFFWRSPVLSIFFTIIILSLAGIPVTFGFISKFYLFMLGIYNQLWFLVISFLIGNIISIFYYSKIIIDLYRKPINYKCNNYSFFIKNWIVTPNGIIVIFVVFFILLLGLYPQVIFENICIK